VPPSRRHWNVDGSLAEKVKLAEVSVTEPDGPESRNVSGGVVSAEPAFSGAKPIPLWSSPPNRVPSLPTQSPVGVAYRAVTPLLREWVGFQARAMPVTGSMAPTPGRSTAPGPAESLPCGLSSQR
jgi:hypothetical protein